MRAKDALGRDGEDTAAAYLQADGLTILERNWRCDLGEIDIVALDGDVLVVCEVKTRSSMLYGSPIDAVTGVKAARLRRLAARWLAEHDLRPRTVQFDVVGIVATGYSEHRIEHLRDVL